MLYHVHHDAFFSFSGWRETRRILICNPFGSNNGKVAENLNDWTLISLSSPAELIL